MKHRGGGGYTAPPRRASDAVLVLALVYFLPVVVFLFVFFTAFLRAFVSPVCPHLGLDTGLVRARRGWLAAML